MDLQVLKFFSVVASEGSFLGASQKLGYAQSNLSTKIKQLERELGAELFVRSAQGVVLTDKGEMLLDYACKLLDLSNEAMRAMTGQGIEKDALHLGAMESAAVSFLPKRLASYHKKNPQISLRVETASSAPLIRKVLQYELDGAFVAGASTHPDLESVTIGKEELVLLTDAANGKKADLSVLLQRPLLVFPYGCSYRHQLETWLSDEGIVPTQIFEFTSLAAIIASLSAGLGIALFPASAVRSFVSASTLSAREVPEPYRSIDIQFVWRKVPWDNKTLNTFIDTLSEN